MFKQAAALHLSALLIILIEWTCPVLAQQANTVSLVHKDLLPAISDGKYELNLLPSTNQQFLLHREVIDHAFPGGGNTANYWVGRWDGDPLAAPVFDTSLYGKADWSSSPDLVYSALELHEVGPDKRPGVFLHILKDLIPVAQFDVSHNKGWIVNISNDGTVVRRLEAQLKVGEFLSPGKAPLKRTFPGAFLNWDFTHDRAIYTNKRTVYLVEGKKEISHAVLPFVVERAYIFPEGNVMVGSQDIGDDGPAWRVMLAADGKVVGQAVFGEWQQFPDRLPEAASRYAIRQAPKVRSSSSYFLVSTEDMRVYRTDNLFVQRVLTPSKAFHPYNSFDTYGGIFTLMSRGDPPHDEQYIIYQESMGNPRPVELVRGNDLAPLLGSTHPVWIFAITASVDGNWLGMTVKTGGEGEKEQWWLLRYKVNLPRSNYGID